MSARGDSKSGARLDGRPGLDGSLSLWDGVSGAVTVEMGNEDAVRATVGRAIEVLGLAGSVLSPVDNITVDGPPTWHNVGVLIDEGQRRREIPARD